MDKPSEVRVRGTPDSAKAVVKSIRKDLEVLDESPPQIDGQDNTKIRIYLLCYAKAEGSA